MGFKCGIVGLPNVGKSTLFNALTETAAAQAANYPFCTIEPNVGEVAVPDSREPVARVVVLEQRLCARCDDHRTGGDERERADGCRRTPQRRSEREDEERQQ